MDRQTLATQPIFKPSTSPNVKLAALVKSDACAAALELMKGESILAANAFLKQAAHLRHADEATAIIFTATRNLGDNHIVAQFTIPGESTVYEIESLCAAPNSRAPGESLFTIRRASTGTAAATAALHDTPPHDQNIHHDVITDELELFEMPALYMLADRVCHYAQACIPYANQNDENATYRKLFASALAPEEPFFIHFFSKWPDTTQQEYRLVAEKIKNGSCEFSREDIDKTISLARAIVAVYASTIAEASKRFNDDQDKNVDQLMDYVAQALADRSVPEKIQRAVTLTFAIDNVDFCAYLVSENKMTAEEYAKIVAHYMRRLASNAERTAFASILKSAIEKGAKFREGLMQESYEMIVASLMPESRKEERREVIDLFSEIYREWMRRHLSDPGDRLHHLASLWSMTVLDFFNASGLKVNNKAVQNRFISNAMMSAYYAIYKKIISDVGKIDVVNYDLGGTDVSTALLISDADTIRIRDALPFGFDEDPEEHEIERLEYITHRAMHGFSSVDILWTIHSARIALEWELSALGAEDISFRRDAARSDRYYCDFLWSHTNNPSDRRKRTIIYTETIFANGPVPAQDHDSTKHSLYLRKGDYTNYSLKGSAEDVIVTFRPMGDRDDYTTMKIYDLEGFPQTDKLAPDEDHTVNIKEGELLILTVKTVWNAGDHVKDTISGREYCIEAVDLKERKVRFAGDSSWTSMKMLEMRYVKLAAPTDNASCGTICQAGHQALLDPKLDAFYKGLSHDAEIMKDILSGQDVIDALDKTKMLARLGTTREQVEAIIAYLRQNGIPDTIDVLLAIPDTNDLAQKLWWIDNPEYTEGAEEEPHLYAGGHFNEAGTRIHISLPLILGELDPREAALAIARHEYKHIRGMGHKHDTGMMLSEKAAQEAKRSSASILKKALLDMRDPAIGSATAAFRAINTLFLRPRKEDIFIMTTPKCPYHCKSCIARMFIEEAGCEEVPEKTVFSYFEQLRGWGRVFLFGPGEPTAYGMDLPEKPDYRNINAHDYDALLRQVRYAEKCGIKNLYIITNAFLIPETEEDAERFFAQFPKNIVWLISTDTTHEQQMKSLPGRNENSLKTVIKTMEKLAGRKIIRTAYNISFSAETPNLESALRHFELTEKYARDPANVFYDAPTDLNNRGYLTTAQHDMLSIYDALDRYRHLTEDDPALYSKPPQLSIDLKGEILLSPLVAFMTPKARESLIPHYHYANVSTDTWDNIYDIGKIDDSTNIASLLLRSRNVDYAVRYDEHPNGSRFSGAGLLLHLFADRISEIIGSENNALHLRELLDTLPISESFRSRNRKDRLPDKMHTILHAFGEYLAGNTEPVRTLLQSCTKKEKEVLTTLLCGLLMAYDLPELRHFAIACFAGEGFTVRPGLSGFAPAIGSALKFFSHQATPNYYHPPPFYSAITEWVEDPVIARGYHAPIYEIDEDSIFDGIPRSLLGYRDTVESIADAVSEGDNTALMKYTWGLRRMQLREVADKSTAVHEFFSVPEPGRWWDMRYPAGIVHMKQIDRWYILEKALSGDSHYTLLEHIHDLSRSQNANTSYSEKMRSFARTLFRDLGQIVAALDNAGLRIDMHDEHEDILLSYGRNTLHERDIANSVIPAAKESSSSKEVFLSRLKKAISSCESPSAEMMDIIRTSFEEGYQDERIPAQSPASADITQTAPPDFSAASTDERALMRLVRERLAAQPDAPKRAAGWPVNETIDLSLIAREADGLNTTDAIAERRRSMQTLARQILWQNNEYGLNVRYALIDEKDTKYRDNALRELKNELRNISRTLSIYVNIDELFELHPEGEGERTIAVKLVDAGKVSTMDIPERTYPVALLRSCEGKGIAIPNYGAASVIGLSLAALRAEIDIHGDYKETAVKMFPLIGNILGRYCKNANDFKSTILEILVEYDGTARRASIITLALEPIAKAPIHELENYHNAIECPLQSA